MGAVSIPLETPRLQLIPVTRDKALDLLGSSLLGLCWAPGFGPVHIPAQAFIDSLPKFAGLHVFLSNELGEAVGYSRFEAGRSTPETVWLYYGVAQQRQGRGFGTEGVGAQVDWLLSQGQVHAVKADVHRSNDASKAVLLKLGFRRGSDAIQEVWVLEAKRHA